MQSALMSNGEGGATLKWENCSRGVIALWNSLLHIR